MKTCISIGQGNFSKVILEIALSLLLICHFFSIVYSNDAKQGDKIYHLNFKEVIVNPISYDSSHYEYGKKHYPQYSIHGLPENFLIKRSPDISLTSKDIITVRISKMAFAPANLSAYDITIYFNVSASRRLYDYTKKNLNKTIALEIGDKIFSIADVLEPIKNKMMISIPNRELEDLKNELSKISKNIIVVNEQRSN